MDNIDVWENKPEIKEDFNKNLEEIFHAIKGGRDCTILDIDPYLNEYHNQELINNPNDYINKEDIYYIYCQHGKTSLKTCIKLSKLGYNVINIMGGYDEWLIKN